MDFDNRKNAAYAILNLISREILNTCESFGGCLTCPERDLCSIMMIIEEKEQKNEKLVEYLKNEKISVKLVTDCDCFAIEKCLSFSIFYFMEKVKWFRLGDTFVSDGFLWWKQTNLPRIQTKVHCSPSGTIYIRFSAEIVRIIPFEHWILDADERFSDLNSGPITHSIRHRWVSCLPKLGKGRIVRVHRRIPETSPFQNYIQIMSYWKKTYGYNLPPEEPEVYYDVLFNNGQTMLYPVYCVLTAKPEALQIRSNCSQLKEGLELFLKSFKEAEITVCGHILSPEVQTEQSIQSYMDVMSMQPVNPSKLKKEQKISRSGEKKKNSESISKDSSWIEKDHFLLLLSR